MAEQQSKTPRTRADERGGPAPTQRKRPRKRRRGGKSRARAREQVGRPVDDSVLRHLGWFDFLEQVAEGLRSTVANEWFSRAMNPPVEAEGEGEANETARGPGLSEVGPFALEAGAAKVVARLDELDGLECLLAVESAARSRDPGLAESIPGLLASLSDLEDMRPSLKAAREGGKLVPAELIGVKMLARAARSLAHWLRAAHSEGGEELWAEPNDGLGADLLELAGSRAGRGLKGLGQSFELDEALLENAAAPGGELRVLAEDLERCIGFDAESGEAIVADGASPELARLRASLGGQQRQLAKRAETMMRSADLRGMLQDEFWTERDGRVVLPVRSDALGRMGTDGAIVHAPSASGRTFFVEPKVLVEGNNRLRETMVRISEEEARILSQLTRDCLAQAGGLRSFQRALTRLDIIAARLAMAERLRCVRPIVLDIPPRPTKSEEGNQDNPPAPITVELPQLRHPLLELDGVDVVASDLRVDVGQALIISGPNAGGKTVSLKALGICLLMARAGFRLPTAPGARMPCFRRIVTDVGDDQSLSANLSTFSAHLVHVRSALAHAAAGERETLALFDEIAVGTDPEQGAALAESILRTMTERGSTIVVTTHYERLKLLAARDRGALAGRFANAAVGFDIEAMRPTFRLTLGVPGSSSAISVARRLGVDEGVLQLAEQLHGGRKRDMEKLLVRLEGERERLEQESRRLTTEREALAYREKAVERKVARAERGSASKHQRALDAATEELHELEAEIRKRRKQLRKAGVDPDSVVTVKGESGDARSKIEDLAGAAQRKGPSKSASKPATKAEPKAWAEGDAVHVVSLDASGEIVGFKGRKVIVQLPGMRTTVAREDLSPARGSGQTSAASEAKVQVRAPAPPKSQAAKYFGDGALSVVAGHDNSILLRGHNVEDAIERVEPFLDAAIMRHIDVVVLRHGHGSGELRKGLRRHLLRLAHVRQFRGGLSKEGGDAVTVVWVDPDRR